MSKKVVLVTGASRGIGLAIAETLLKNGSRVYGLGRTKLPELPRVAKLQQEFANDFVYESADVTVEADAKRALANLLAKFGVLDAVVHNAGVLKPIVKISDLCTDKAEWAAYKELFSVNYFSVIYLTSLCLPELRKTNGRAIYVSSGAANHGYHGWSAYCASKAALNMFNECLSIEEPNVFSVAIRPGVVDTEMQTDIRNEGLRGMGPLLHEQFVNFKSKNVLLPPEKPAAIICKLAVSDDFAQQDFNGKFFSWDDVVFSKF